MTLAREKAYATKNFSAVILAAGQSSRLGKPKQLLIYQNKTLLQRAIDAALQSSAQSVVVVLGSEMDTILNTINRGRACVVKNEDWKTGLASTIRCGIEALQGTSPTTDGAILLVCDQPFVSSDLLNKLIEKQKETGRAIVASEYEGTLGTPVFFHRSFFSQLSALQGDTGAKKIMMQNPNLLVSVPFLQGGIDIDTLSDYERLEK